MTTFDTCQMKWFINYILGYREPSGKAATIGTCCHYILESVAKSKLLRQEGRQYRKDKVLGYIRRKYSLDEWIDSAYDYFSKQESHLVWKAADKREVISNINKAKHHAFFPENHKEIISPEQYFTIPIDEEWATYTVLEKDKPVKKQVYITGIIDLIFRDNFDNLNYLDYKFGRVFDWAKFEEKDYTSMISDTQLCLYYYAITKKYPKETDIITNIWYVKADKFFVLSFGEETIDFIKQKLRSFFESVKYMMEPMCRYGRHCTFCPYKKYSFDFWDREKLNIPYRTENKFSDVEGFSTVCDATRNFVKYRGLELTIANAKIGRSK